MENDEPVSTFIDQIGLSFRIAGSSDIPALAALVNSAFEIETFYEGSRTDERSIEEMIENGEFLILEDIESRLLASVYTKVHGNRGYLGMFAVRPSHQGHGLARIIIRAAENHCKIRGCDWIDVKVLSLRTVLLPFYHSLGFVETGVEEFPPLLPMKPGVECHFIRMSKPL
jgi:GNAT superfamily N-acetyltransferase